MLKKFIVLVLMLIFTYSGFSQSIIKRNNWLMISVAGGIGTYDMKNINSIYINKFLKPMADFQDNIDYGSVFNISISYIKLKKINLGIGINYYRASASQEKKIANVIQPPYSDFKRTIITTAILPELYVDYSIENKNNINFNIGLSGLYGLCEMSVKEQVDDKEEECVLKHSPDGFGLKVFTSISKNIFYKYFLGVEVGYKYFISDDIIHNENKWYVEVVDQETPMNLDFSGIYLIGKLVFVI